MAAETRSSQGLRRPDKRAQRGAALVEYAFISIIFLGLLFGIGGFGHALYVYHHLNNVAKEATRYATVRGLNCSQDSSCAASNSASGVAGPTTQSDIQAYVLSITPPGIDTSQITTTATWPGPNSPPICFHDITFPGGAVVTKIPNNSPNCTVQVQIQYNHTFVFPLIRATSLNMQTSSEMIIVH